MYDTPHAGVEVARTSSIFLAAWAVYADWISNYGAAVLTSLGIAYAIYQFYARSREHRAIMKKNEVPNEQPGE